MHQVCVAETLSGQVLDTESYLNHKEDPEGSSDEEVAASPDQEHVHWYLE
jgi:hypothetical protein